MSQIDTPHIAVEPLLFGDYRVQVWDEHCESLLDREYFVRGFTAALLTAESIKQDMFSHLDIEIYPNPLTV